MVSDGGTGSDSVEVLWRPQPGPQRALLACPIFEVFYGGARGGGKTDGCLGEWAQHAQAFGASASGMFVRRELTQLDEAIHRSHALFAPTGARWGEQKKTWVFPGGGRLKFRPLERAADAEKYQGHSYTRVYVEEATNFPDPAPIDRLRATLRSSAGVPCRLRLTGNPGGPGHSWVKARYIDPAPEGWTRIVENEGGEGGDLDRLFIPARLADNLALLDADPAYPARLRQSGSAVLVRAWLEGDWSVVEGAFFDCWRPGRHVLPPTPLPASWLRFRSFDWGSARPFSVGWWAVTSEDWQHPSGTVVERGALVRYREWYGANGPNRGLKLTAEAVALGIRARTPAGEDIAYTAADPACFIQDGGPSLAERFARSGVPLRRADNQRVPGWDQLRRRLVGDGAGQNDRAMILCFETCRDSIRTLPALTHDPTRTEDLDTRGEDHAADEWRYACMSRPYTRPPPSVPRAGSLSLGRAQTFNELRRSITARRRAREP